MLGANELSAGGLVVGPEPSKLMARVQIPAGAFLSMMNRSHSFSPDSGGVIGLKTKTAL